MPAAVEFALGASRPEGRARKKGFGMGAILEKIPGRWPFLVPKLAKTLFKTEA